MATGDVEETRPRLFAMGEVIMTSVGRVALICDGQIATGCCQVENIVVELLKSKEVAQLMHVCIQEKAIQIEQVESTRLLETAFLSDMSLNTYDITL